MSRVCYFTGRKTHAGRSISRRGKARHLGGAGRKITGVTRRTFKPNIQKVRALVNGSVFLHIKEENEYKRGEEQGI